MKIALIIISVVLIAIVLIQGSPNSDGANIISGGNSDLFANRKERGGELFISRFTALLGVAFMVLCALL